LIVPLVADFSDRLKASSSSAAFAVRENFFRNEQY
jgi:hypothetical protein